MRLGRVLLIVGVAVCAACGSDTPLSPANPVPLTLTPTSSPGSGITFLGLTAHGSSVTRYNEAGFTLTASGGDWVASTTYGKPQPFIQFTAQAGQTVEGRIEVTAGGATFLFGNVDLYASVIPIPYTIVGLRKSEVVFSFTDRLPNTFGNFRTVSNPHATTPIDALRIVLTNAGPACCSNPMGLDNLVFGQ